MGQSAVAGLVGGGIFALIGVVVVVMFRAVRVLNFAQAAIGAFGMFTMAELHGNGMAYGLATVLGILTAAALGALLGFAMTQWFADASLETRSTVAIGYLVTLLAVGFRVFGDSPREIPPLFGDGGVTVFGVVVSTSAIAVVAAAILIAAVVGLLLAHTTGGLRVQALSERPQTAELIGIPVRWISVGVWAAGGAIAAFGVQVIAPTRASDFLSLSLLILPGFAAAALGVFRSVWAAVIGGLTIGVLEGVVTHYSAIAVYQAAVPLVVLALVLMWSQRREVWDVAR